MNVDLFWHHVRKCLKHTKKLSFKKGSARRIGLNKNRLSCLRILYSIRLIKRLNEDVLMINIDEVSFSPKVLNWRSWLKLTLIESALSKYSGAISLIWAISSDGKYIAAALNNRLNLNTFIEFLKIIEHLINEYHQDYYRKVLILLENWSINRRKQSKDYMSKADSRFIFLPHYSPSLVPIELIFAKIKKSIAILTQTRSHIGTLARESAQLAKV